VIISVSVVSTLIVIINCAALYKNLVFVKFMLLSAALFYFFLS
jgi:hypothetical protein